MCHRLNTLKKLAEGIAYCQEVFVDHQRIQTNLVTVKINYPKFTLSKFIEKLKEQNVLVIPFDIDSLRMALR